MLRQKWQCKKIMWIQNKKASNYTTKNREKHRKSAKLPWHHIFDSIKSLKKFGEKNGIGLEFLSN